MFGVEAGHLNQAKIMGCDWYPHRTLAIYTGMRNGELYALTWDKVDFENKMILVDSSWSKRNGLKSTKSGGWKSMKTTMIYVRKSGVDIKRMKDNFELHNPYHETAKVLNLQSTSR